VYFLAGFRKYPNIKEGISRNSVYGSAGMAIEFACQCGKTLRAADQFAGKRAKCNNCGQIVNIPAGNAAVGSASPPKAAMAYNAVAAAPKRDVPAAIPVAASNFDLDEFFSGDIPVASPAAPDLTAGRALPNAARADMKFCPGCKQPMSNAAVICIQCGYNQKTGEKMKTFAYSPSTTYEKSTPRRRPSAARNFFASRLGSGKLWCGLAMMVGAVIWFFGALAIGIIFFYPPILFIIGLISFFTGLIDGDNA
jgi:hypothetical protein